MTTRQRPLYRTLAWKLGLLAAALIAAGLWGSAAEGFFDPVLTVLLSAGLYGIVGAMIASRQPHNSTGWLMLAVTLVWAVSVLPFDFGSWVVASGVGPRPIGVASLWIGSWLWVLPFGLGLPAILGRFPGGRLRSHWVVIDLLSVAGTVLFGFALAFRPGPMYPVGLIANPLGQPGATQTIALVSAVGLILVLIAYGLAVLSIGRRLLRAHGDERQQLKWVTVSACLVVASLGFGVGGHIAYHLSLLPALVPVSVATLTLPIALGVAILRYRLYDIDLIINRAFVYGGLTAILAGLYTLVVALSQRLFVFYTGQRSDAVVLTAFVVATAFTPVKDGLQKLADRRLRLRDPAAALQGLGGSIESVVNVLDTPRIARRLVQDATEAFEAGGGKLYLNPHDARPFHAIGRVDRPEAVVALHGNGQIVGRLILGSRRGDAPYSRREMAALQYAADSLGQALVLAREHPVPNSHLAGVGGDVPALTHKGTGAIQTALVPQAIASALIVETEDLGIKTEIL
jgi:hypothetical protein